jgi:hypothetical protein
LLQLGAAQSMPLGIVTKNLDLCEDSEPRSHSNAPLSMALDAILENSGYAWHSQDGVLQIRPARRVTPIETRILRFRLQSFGGTTTAMQGLGIFLAGQIRSIQHPGEGYAGDILSSPDSETIAAFRLHNVTVEETANYIVSQGSKGVWLLHETRGGDISFKALGYKDDRNILEKMKCAGENR